MMKISNSKRQLAQLLIEAGVTQFPDGANWAAQDKSRNTAFFIGKPRRSSDGQSWLENLDTKWGQRTYDINNAEVYLPTLIPNWHQAVLSRDEFDRIVAETTVGNEPDADGWIEWNGGGCPVGEDDIIDVKFSDGDTLFGVDGAWDWGECNDGCSIIAYRMHQHDQGCPEFCESATRSIQEPETKPTIEQLAADYRNRKDYADRKQQEADEAKADAEAKLAELVAAGNALNLVISVSEKESELAITDWRDLRAGDIIQAVDFCDDRSNQERYKGGWADSNFLKEFSVLNVTGDGRIEIDSDNPLAPKYSTDDGIAFRFIRRPTK